MVLYPYVFGISVLLVLWLFYWMLTGTCNPWKLVDGADGRPSTSKLQWFLWTVVIIFSYTAVSCSSGFKTISNIPPNVLIAMGLSVTTMAAAKGITVSYVDNRKIVKSNVQKDKTDQTAVRGNKAKQTVVQEYKRDPTAGPGSLVQDDDGFPDLSKIQMLVWTLIAVAFYLLRTVQAIQGKESELPDIDAALMVLMGLGQGAYLGKKLTTTRVPRLTGLSPGSGNPGIEITIMGASFGDTQGGSLITIDGNPIHPEVSSWQDAQVKFKIPARQPNGTGWPAGQRIYVGLIVGGQDSTNALPFTVIGDNQE